ncbi:tetratricopeptide repeat protein [Salinimonas sp. HHU 13199]|uniref:Tetratricopeptide repeat protein n=1 Tax=Salinimonas profundi TaxID=2729140 RepID=A0ABR8LMD5_9ALTE|nr:putative 2OG-Fe(II) oxygenase [Salinimonas profundi]MBD3585260.1 tetratricopeptide repeat protein [Salinimonas profundi]
MATCNNRHDLIELGKQAFNAKNYIEAIRHFSDRLNQQSDDAQALQYLVYSHLHLGDANKANALLAKYTEQHSATSNFWLCKVQVAQFQQNLEEEYSAYQQLFKRFGKSLQWLERFITLCTSLHRFDEAKTAINTLIDDHNISEQKRIILWLNYYKSCERHQEALVKAKTLYHLNPQSPYNLNELAVCYRLSGEPGKAVDILTPLAVKKPHYAVYHNLANALSDEGKLSEAISWYRKALKMNPLYIDSHINLNKLLWESGDTSEYLNSFKKAIQAHPLAHHLSLAYASFLVDEKRYKDAIAHIENANLPDYLNIAQLRIIAQAYLYDGESVEAVPILEQITQHKGGTTSDNITYGISLISTGNYSLAEKVLSDTLTRQPENQLAKAYHYAAKRLISDNFEGLAGKIETFSPNSIDEQFWYSLIEEIIPLHASKNNPLGQTLEKGTQTRGHLFKNSGKYVKQLKAFLDRSIRTYCERQNIDIALLTDADDEINYIGSWSVRLNGKGFHHNHIHSKGRISGVVYLKLPSDVANEEMKAGWLKLGQPHLYGHDELLPEIFIKPEVGKCVLFPSHAWHGTTPILDDAERITVAFDVGRYGLDR